MTYEFLESYEDVAEVFNQFGVDVPQRELSEIVVARNEEEEVVGFLTLQLLPHMEPLWIKPGSGVEWRKLAGALEEGLEGLRMSVYAFSQDEKVEGMLEKSGFSAQPYKVWAKEYGRKED